MNRQFHNKGQSLTITDKQAGVDKLFDGSKIYYWSHINLEEKSHKMSFKALSVKLQQSKKTDREGMAQCAPPSHFLEQIGLMLYADYNRKL